MVFLGFQKGLAVLGIVFLATVGSPVEPRQTVPLPDAFEGFPSRENMESHPFFAVPGKERSIAVGVYVPHRAAHEALRIGWEKAGKPPLTVLLDLRMWEREEQSRLPSAPHLRLPEREVSWPPSWEIGLAWETPLQEDEGDGKPPSPHPGFRANKLFFPAHEERTGDHRREEGLARRLQNERDEVARLFGRAPEEVSYLWLPELPHRQEDVAALSEICRREGMRLVVGQKTLTPHVEGREKESVYGGGLVVLKWTEGATSDWIAEELQDLQIRWNVVPFRALVYGENTRVAPK
ncbi:MAG: hypothetical protein KM296_07810 [Brockia lithotrophica]|nr:hypothetical protein [Brockia lithotrophica]